MYPDKSLLPREAVRLAALGLLAGGPMSYAALAAEIRHFVSHIAGPSPELMGVSVELLRHEGLIRPEGESLSLTEAGRDELRALLRSAVRAPLNDVNKLILALKFRFLHLLPAAERRLQVAMMIEACEVEYARLLELRARHAAAPGDLAAWLDHDLDLIERRLGWLRDFHAAIAG